MQININSREVLGFPKKCANLQAKMFHFFLIDPEDAASMNFFYMFFSVSLFLSPLFSLLSYLKLVDINFCDKSKNKE